MDRQPPPRPSPQDVGRLGERLAAAHLERRGWTILARNYRAGRKEIDLIARRGRTVAFVEVKTRRGQGFGHPLEAITWRKRREIAEVARAWRSEHPTGGTTLRFDALSVVLERGKEPVIEHVEGAWTLG